MTLSELEEYLVKNNASIKIACENIFVARDGRLCATTMWKVILNLPNGLLVNHSATDFNVVLNETLGVK